MTYFLETLETAHRHPWQDLQQKVHMSSTVCCNYLCKDVSIVVREAGKNWSSFEDLGASMVTEAPPPPQFLLRLLKSSETLVKGQEVQAQRHWGGGTVPAPLRGQVAPVCLCP